MEEFWNTALWHLASVLEFNYEPRGQGRVLSSARIGTLRGRRVEESCSEMAVEVLQLKPAIGSGSGVGRTRLLVFSLLSTDHVPGPSSWTLHWRRGYVSHKAFCSLDWP